MARLRMVLAAVFAAEEIGHPLLPRAKCVRNSVTLGESLAENLRLLIVSGSNMSGKSTLMRTIGTNAVLALAGTVVRANSLRLSELRIGASLRISDSLREGESRFSAEIGRIRRIMDLALQFKPTLFLIDEILNGTNSQDRQTGSQVILRRLIESGAFGMITTHDLALTRVGEMFPSQVRNAHFRDTIVDGRMVFDYKLHPGVVQGSNAVELTRTLLTGMSTQPKPEQSRDKTNRDEGLAAEQRPVPSQAEGDLETIEKDLRDKSTEGTKPNSGQ